MSSPADNSERSNHMVQGDIAIIGMACLFPGAPNLDAFWENIVGAVDATSDPPPEAWDAGVFYAPDTAENDRVYCKRGGFLGPLARFDPLEHGVMPSALDGSEPDQWLALQVARAALADAGYTDQIPERHRTAVILGKGTYLNRGNLAAAQHGQVIDQTLAILRALHPEYTEADLQVIRHELKRGLPPFNTDTAPGLIPNVTVGRIANRLDLMGPSYTVDAACASSLVAVDIARRDLLTHHCDLALVGGVHVVTPVPVLMLFCHLGALSRRQQIRPFDKDADGTLLSEGLGMVVLKRLEDAQRDGNRIYATIKGVGIASDGKAVSVLAPRVEGEELALRRAYEQAGISPRTVGLIEAHGTATLVGDATEIRALTRVMGERGEALPWCAIGTIKSNIGHTMPAAGIAGLIKAALALYHRTLPPTLNVDQPSPRLELDKTPFYINTKARPWIHGAIGAARRAGVNAFGFGGIDAHVILEEYPHADPASAERRHLRWESEVCILSGATRGDLIQQGQQLQRFLAAAPAVALKDLAYTLNTTDRATGTPTGTRLALVAASVQDLRTKLDRALERLADPACRKIKDVNGIYFFEEPLGRTGKLAFLFPGEGAQYVNMLADLCLHFPEVQACFDEMDRVFAHHVRGHVLSDVLFPRPGFSDAERAEAEDRLWRMDAAIEALVTANHALFTLLDRLGIRPDAMLGHSTGEFSAMRASGMLALDNYERSVLDLNQRYREIETTSGVPAATLLAVGAGRSQAAALAAEIGDGIFVAMDNCPHQVVLAGSRPAIDRALERARGQGLICETLAFSRAYHTPLYARYAESLRESMASWVVAPPQLPLYSCTSVAPYPSDLAAARSLAHEHWVRPVEFRQTIEAMHNDGIRLFVEVGPRGNLTAFVDDILRGKPYLAVPADVTRRSGITQLNHLVGLLAAHAVPMRLEPLYNRRAPRRLDLSQADGAHEVSKRAGVQLATGWPPMTLSDATAARLRKGVQAPVPSGPAKNGSADAHSSQPAPNDPLHMLAPKVALPSLPITATPHTANGNGVISAPRLAETATQPTPASQPAPTPRAAQIMSAYLHTMEQFLAVQQEVMQAYLRGAQAPSTTTAGVVPAMAASLDSQSAHDAVWADSADKPLEMKITASAAAVVPEKALDPAAIGQILLRIVSEKTGYPSEMLGFNLDLEADLGIDSIKRVEILGEFQHETDLLLSEQMDALSARRTLQGVIDFLAQLQDGMLVAEPAPLPAHASATSETLAGSARQTDSTPLLAHSAADVPSLPFIGQVIELSPGRLLVARVMIDVAAYPCLRDHTLGRRAATSDSESIGLPVMPFTMSMEMLAEAAAILVPGEKLIGMKDVRAYRWIALDDATIALQLSAQRPDLAQEVHVQIHEVTAAGMAPTPIVEGKVVFGHAYPNAPFAAPLSLREETQPKWPPERLYEEAMFHGPAFRGVRRLDRIGEDGAEATLEVLALDALFAQGDGRVCLTDPVLLDQPGQVVGFWAAQNLEQGYLVLPFRLEALQIYGPLLPPGARATCHVRITHLGEEQVRSDLDIVDGDGRIWARFVGWEDRRFDLPQTCYRLLLAPQEVMLSAPWPAAVAALPADHGVHARRLGLEDFPEGFFSAHGGIWQRVLARLLLGQRELELWRALHTPEPRRLEWLLGRIAAKDAVRHYLRQHDDLALNPADIEILPNHNGQPVAQGPWVDQVAAPPILSLSHTAGLAVALVGDATAAAGLGIDIELAGRMREQTQRLAFTAREQELLASVGDPQRDAWALRGWCAKEAAAKALGQGMAGGPQTLEIQAIDAQNGRMQVGVAGELARRVPAMQGSALTAYTACEGDLTVATSLYVRERGA